MTNKRIIYNDGVIGRKRFKTREVMVGNIGIGGDNPIRIQSMTTISTMDTSGSVSQAIRMIKAGCELVRITAPNVKEAKNLYDIKNKLIQSGYNTPLVADVHFTPNAAIEAAKIVDKVRINPGNFVDKKLFKTHRYSEKTYQEELKKIEEKLYPLIEVCKANKTSMRIGTNHGSLSDRIMSRYGDTPLGMVESALEFVRVCKSIGYNEIILSMKASNPIVMIQAYRLLVHKMENENMNYPIHLGVTEAGEGDDGRIKSAMGIGSLLMDGIGDTIRVSLTEPPENEIPVAELILNYTKKMRVDFNKNYISTPQNPFMYIRRETTPVMNIGGGSAPIVVANFVNKPKIVQDDFNAIGYTYCSSLDKWDISDMACDYVLVGDSDIDFEVPGTLGVIYNYETWRLHKKGYPLLSEEQYLSQQSVSKKLNIVSIVDHNLPTFLINKLIGDPTAVLFVQTNNLGGLYNLRKIFLNIITKGVRNPIIVNISYKAVLKNELQIFGSIDIGSLLLDGLGDGVSIFLDQQHERSMVNTILFNILQGSRSRISKTEYISCPSCGRTQFDLEKTTAKIREKTSHLKGIKIGIMGCIVNGPGEMADADYGYVGTGIDRISLYKKKEIVKKNINSEDALDELIKLIKDNGDWRDS